MLADVRWRVVGVVSVAGVITSACVGSSAESSGDGSTGGSGSVTANVTTLTAGSESGGQLEGCGDNLLADPGFEEGTATTAWEAVSPLFETAICNAECTDDAGAGPFVGDWWVWFGGIAQPDTPSVSQTVVIPDGLAMLRFGFSINAGSGTGNDVFTVSMDTNSLLRLTDAAVASYGGWRVVEIDVSSFADGEEHTLTFAANIAGVGVTNFFVDEVELLPCEDVTGSSGTSSSSTTAAMTDSSGTGTG